MTKKSIKKLAQLIIAISILILLFVNVQSYATAKSGDPFAVDLNTSEKAFQQTSDDVVIYFFWGDGCPHCAEAEPFLEELAQNNPRVVLKPFEVRYDQDNAALLEKFAAGFGFQAKYVPTIFIGEKSWQGYSEEIEAEIEASVMEYLESGYIDKGAQFLEETETTVQPTPEPVVEEQNDVLDETSTPDKKEIKLPLIGTIDLSNQSLLVSTILIAFVDGFNPCSLWVLGMLLSIALHAGSRKKVLIIGLVFITVTAAIYALFIAGLFTVFKVVSFLGWIRVLVALVALFFALVNIKDYFWYKKGVSLTIDDKNKPGIYRNIRKIMDAGDSFWGLVGGTIVLAAGVSIVEFACTAGFPVIWTNLLTTQNASTLAFILLLVVYMVIYQLDELAIFLVSVFTLKASKVEEKHGRVLKLIGGVLMLTLAGVMLIEPSLMNDLGKSLLVFAFAFGLTGLILLVHRVILPKFGVKVESDTKSRKRH